VDKSSGRAFVRTVVTCTLLLVAVVGANSVHAQPQGTTGTLIVFVHHEDGPIAQAEVHAGPASGITGEDGRVTLTVPVGRVDVIATRAGFDPGAAPIEIVAGVESRMEIELQPQSAIEETIVVTSTRAERRIEDEPLRVEVVPAEEVEEKIAMAPGDVSMLLAETNGLRVQATSPSLGGATVRIQGLSGRYTQVLADGLPLYGGQSGSVGILQIPPMDLAQVEVIKGVASALYGMSAIGGVVNLVSRRPVQGAPEREFLINRTTHDGTDGAIWIAQALNERWGFTTLGGLHMQNRSDLDGDGWTDLPMFRRVQARPRLLWDNHNGRSALFTLGGMSEQRRGGSVPGATLRDGTAHSENLDTTRIDAGFVGRFLTSGGRVLAVRASAVTQHYDHTFGTVRERSRRGTWFGETSMTATNGKNTWVGGAAIQRDSLRSTEVNRFDYGYTTVGVFGQDDLAVNQRVILSASGRVDVHSEFGTFASPKLSALLRLGGGFTTRVSGGGGHIAPSPFTDETEATGLTPLAPFGTLEPEDAFNVSGDVTWNRAPIEVTATVFRSRIRNALMFEELESGPFAGRIVNAEQPTRTTGTELIARLHQEDFDVILTHMFIWSTESNLEGGGLREVPLNPRHTASFDLLWEFGSSQIGVEAFYSGRQALEDNPYRTRSDDYILWGFLFMHRIGAAVLYVNTENLSDVRQTRHDPLLRQRPLRDGRWSTDVWAPLEGRTMNAGLRFRF
jgi:outer membrane receptor for ferrienterochelin and colicins